MAAPMAADFGTMSDGAHAVDRVYVAACARDLRFARICIASIRYFYPDVPIHILAGGALEPGFAREVKKFWSVDVADLPTGDYGVGFVKLEALFGPAGLRFLVLDADTIFAGKVLDAHAGVAAPFVVDDEQLPETDLKRLYYDWDRLKGVDPDAQPAWRAFNSGQWFGTAGVLTREDFEPWVEWGLPRRLRHPRWFMSGDQGVLNYVLIRKAALEGLGLERREIMRWPGHSLAGLDVAGVAAGTAPPLVVHWAGMKATLLRDMRGGDLLRFFEACYYRRLPFGLLRQALALGRHLWAQGWYEASRRVALRWRSWSRPPAQPAPHPEVAR
jgi:hypothetical protein